MNNIYKHFQSDACLAGDYGYPVIDEPCKKFKQNEQQNQRRKRNHETTEKTVTTVTIKAPAEIHEVHCHKANRRRLGRGRIIEENELVRTFVRYIFPQKILLI